MQPWRVAVPPRSPPKPKADEDVEAREASKAEQLQQGRAKRSTSSRFTVQ